MPPRLLECRLQLPAHDKPGEYLLRISFKVGTEEGLGFELLLRIAHQNPAQGYGEQARAVPHGRLGSDLDHALPAPIPVGDRDGLPNGGRIFGHHRKVGQPLALEARPPYLTWASWRGRFVKGGIQAQAGDEDDRVGELAATRKQLKRSVGTVRHGHDLAFWVPVPYQQEQLPGPLGYLLVPSASLGGITLGRSQGREERQGPNPRSPR